MFQRSDAIQSAINAIESVGVKGNREYVLPDEQHDQSIDNVQSHADYKSPLLALACEIPEEHEHSRNPAVNNQAKGKAGLSGLTGERVYKLRNPQPENKTDAGPAHGKNGVDER